VDSEQETSSIAKVPTPQPLIFITNAKKEQQICEPEAKSLAKVTTSPL